MINVILENAEYFSVNGVFYSREFIGKTANGQLAIVNSDDTDHMLTSFSDVDRYNIAGVVYNNLIELEKNLLQITFVEIDESNTGNTANSVQLSFETVSKNLKALNVISSTANSMTYSNGITKTITNPSSDTIVITLSGNTPTGISLTKTITTYEDKLPTTIFT